MLQEPRLPVDEPIRASFTTSLTTQKHRVVLYGKCGLCEQGQPLTHLSTTLRVSLCAICGSDMAEAEIVLNGAGLTAHVLPLRAEDKGEGTEVAP